MVSTQVRKFEREQFGETVKLFGFWESGAWEWGERVGRGRRIGKGGGRSKEINFLAKQNGHLFAYFPLIIEH